MDRDLTWVQVDGRSRTPMQAAEVVPGRLSVVLRQDADTIRLGVATWTATVLLHSHEPSGIDTPLTLLRGTDSAEAQQRLAQMAPADWLVQVGRWNDQAPTTVLHELRLLLSLDAQGRALLDTLRGLPLAEAVQVVRAALAYPRT